MVISVFGMLFEEGGKLFRDTIISSLTRKSGSKSASADGDELKNLEAAFREVEEKGEIPKTDEKDEPQTPPAMKRGTRAVRCHRNMRNNQRFYPQGNGFITNMAIRTRRAVRSRAKR